MKRTVVAAGFASATVLLACADAQACGDKFLVVGRGMRYQRVHPAAHPASILIYMNPDSRVPAAAKEIQLQSSLKRAGHRVEAVDNAASLQDALKSARYDLVLADISDSPALERQVGSQPSMPVVVPVLYRPTGNELVAAQKQYGCTINAPSKDYLAAIDEAMTQRLKKGRAAR
jgi:CheY-like chemotaxis protein